MHDQWLTDAARQNGARQKDAAKERLSWLHTARFQAWQDRLIVWRNAHLYAVAAALPPPPAYVRCYRILPAGDGVDARAAFVCDLYSQVWAAWHHGDAWGWPYGDFVAAYEALPRSKMASDIYHSMETWAYGSSGWWQWHMLLDSLPNPYL